MIRIFQRHCNFSSNSHNKPRPEWFDREKIFDSLISTLDERVDYTAFHDSGNGGIEDHFLKNKDVNKVSQKGGNGIRLSGAKNKFNEFINKNKIPTLLTWSGIDLIESDNEKVS